MPLLNNVAVVGCGLSPVGKLLGKDIDAHDFVIRANRAYRTAGIEKDWGTKTDLIVLGNPYPILSTEKKPFPFDYIEVPKLWRNYKDLWPYDRKPLAGTFAAMHACRLGAKSITLYGIDLYCDALKDGKLIYGKTIFRGHPAVPPPRGFSDLNLDRQALLNLPCKVTWINPPPP